MTFWSQIPYSFKTSRNGDNWTSGEDEYDVAKLSEDNSNSDGSGTDTETYMQADMDAAEFALRGTSAV